MKTGEKKPEHLTSLSGNRMVSKTHRRITFRGIIDSLEAEVIEAQVLASERGEAEICGNLGEVLDCLRAIMTAEVKDTPLPPPFLFGMDAEEIHSRSREVFQVPAWNQGAVAARINTLRAKLREAELLAVKVFGPGQEDEREDIILIMNRLSSALWWLFCRSID